MARIVLGEQLVHGLDLARAAGANWDISRQDALEVIQGVMTVVPDYMDPVAARHVAVSYELRLGDGPACRMDIDHGSATVGPPNGRADCRITADPVGFLLVGHGRIGQWSQILRGKLAAGGPKPWLGLRFGKLLISV